MFAKRVAKCLPVKRTVRLDTARFSSNVSDSLKVKFNANGVVVISFSTPHNLNALTVDVGGEFARIVNDLCTLDSTKLRCIVLTGEGKAFSAGGDLQFLLDRTKDEPLRNSSIMRDFYRRFLSIRSLPVPVIAAVNGAAIGAGR